jgi:hypothetical protein
VKLLLDTKFSRNKKLLEVVGDLKSTRKEVGWSLILLWAWTLDNREDGDLGAMTAHDICEVCEWKGDADQFIAALARRGLLERRAEDTLLVHEFQEHQGKLVRDRVAARNRQREHRKSQQKAESVTDVTVTRHDPVTPVTESPVTDVATNMTKTLSGSSALATLVATWNGHKGAAKISVDKGIGHIEFALSRGAKLQDVEKALWDAQAAAGRTIWERLEPLTKAPEKNAASHIRDILARSQPKKPEPEPERSGMRRMA